MSEKFEGFSEKTQLYYQYYKYTNEIKKAFEKDRKLLAGIFFTLATFKIILIIIPAFIVSPIPLEKIILKNILRCSISGTEKMTWLVLIQRV